MNMTTSAKTLRFAYFGTPEFAAIILDELLQKGISPALIITAPDKPKGRKLLLAPSQVKLWANAHDIPVLTPLKLTAEDMLTKLREANCELFIVAAYGRILPKVVLEMPKFGVVNVHPSLLPKFRGSSPIESAILSDERSTGVTIMQLDEEMDHGPIIAQRERVINNWPPKGSELTRDLAHFGGILLADIIPEWLSGLKASPQDHTRATFTKKIAKEDGLIDLNADPFQNYKKIRAFDEWPGAYFFTERNGKSVRVRITEASFSGDLLSLERVIPEGRKEMSYQDFLRGGR